jgi:hypothetical protein
MAQPPGASKEGIVCGAARLPGGKIGSRRRGEAGVTGGESIRMLPIWGVFIGTLLLVLLSIDLGYRWARHKQRLWAATDEQEKEAPVGAMVGATLGLLAFLLAFTFGMAADHFHARKVALLDEANAIRTAYLRADMIDEAQRTEVRRILREYVDERLQWTGAAPRGRAHSAQELLDRLWAQAAAVGRAQPGQEATALFVESVNHVITLNAERVMVRERSRIPGALAAVMFLISVVSFAAMGYHGGVSGTIRSPVMIAVAVAFSLVIMLIADLDRPGEGFINVSQDAMLEVRTWMDQPGR